MGLELEPGCGDSIGLELEWDYYPKCFALIRFINFCMGSLKTQVLTKVT